MKGSVNSEPTVAVLNNAAATTPTPSEVLDLRVVGQSPGSAVITVYVMAFDDAFTVTGLDFYSLEVVVSAAGGGGITPVALSFWDVVLWPVRTVQGWFGCGPKPPKEIVYTLYYQILTDQTTSLTTAQSYMDAADQAFSKTYGIHLERLYDSEQISELNQKPGCTRGNNICNASCGLLANCSDCVTLHHKSSEHFLGVDHENLSTATTAICRFVSFRICNYDYISKEHSEVNGVAYRRGFGSPITTCDTLVTTQAPRPYRTTAHEISHLFGARDSVCNSRDCVMNPISQVDDVWCRQCKADIDAYLKSLL